MKQGKASTSPTAPMKQPISKAIDPGAVSRLGTIQGPGTVLKKLVFGPGLEAPMVGETQHKSGSQGKH